MEDLICFSRSQNHKVQKKVEKGRKYKIQRLAEKERGRERDTHTQRYGWDPSKGVFYHEMFVEAICSFNRGSGRR